MCFPPLHSNVFPPISCRPIVLLWIFNVVSSFYIIQNDREEVNTQEKLFWMNRTSCLKAKKNFHLLIQTDPSTTQKMKIVHIVSESIFSKHHPLIPIKQGRQISNLVH